ncbi:MAG: mechanosensitive ion channel [Cyanobacteriota bacterium]|nr:mechanosensitive ion channel [Cyanobacteriota bacterium]
MFRHQIRAFFITGIVCTVVSWGIPIRSQEIPVEETQAQSVQTVAITIEDPEIPVDELKLLVKPLTLSELDTEAAAWQVLLRQKVQEISDAEIAVKRQNRAINKQLEAANALEEATKALEAAQESQSIATEGSPEYEEAARKVEEAQDNLKKAQEAVEEATTTKEELQEDEALSSAIEEAQETSTLELAKKVLENAKKEREKMDAWSYDYEDITAQINRLEIAIENFEYAQEIQENTPPDTWEYDDATQKLEAARDSLKQATEEIEGANTTQSNSTEESSRNLNAAANALDNTEIEGNLEIKVASSVGGVDSLENIDQKQDQLEEVTEQLQENAEADSDLKNQLVSNVTELQAERTAIIDRFEIVLDEFEKKGGEINSYNNYIQAVSGIEIDLQDTEGLAVRLIGWVKSEEGGLRWGMNLGKFVSIVVASIIVSQILSLIINRSLKQFGNTSDIFRQFIVVLVRRGGVVVGCMIGLTALEVSLGPILALVGGASFVLAFALQSNLSNLASGLMLMIYKPFDTGDEVMVGDIWGYVDSITLANTTIKGWKSEIISIPNDMIWGSIIKNLTAGDTRKGSLTIRVPFTQSLPEVKRILMEIGESHPLTLKTGTFVWEYAEYSVMVILSFTSKNSDFWTVWEDLLIRVQQRFEQEGIPIALPTEVKIEHESNGKLSQPTVALSHK